MTVLECRLATFDDYPGIWKLQQAFWDSRNKPVMKRDPTIAWMVCINKFKRVVGCYSFEDVEGQRWIRDFYREDSKAGLLAIRTMKNHLERGAALDNLPVCFFVEPTNKAWLERVFANDYEMVAIVFIKTPKMPKLE